MVETEMEEVNARPRSELWPHLTNLERACLMDWWVMLERARGS